MSEYVLPPGQLDYDHNQLASLTALGEKGSSLKLEAFRGRIGFKVFQDGKKPIGISFKQGMLTVIVDALECQLKASPGASPVKIGLQKYDTTTKTSSDDGAIVIGRDEKNIIYIGIWKQDVGKDGRLKFPLRLPLSFSLSDDDAVRQSELAVRDFITTLNFDARMAAVLSSFRRQRDSQGGGNRGGGGGSIDDAIRW